MEWNKTLMGPIEDEIGLEQGGCNSGDYYKVFARSQLDSCQRSGLGVRLFTDTVSAIGEADDTVVLSNSIHSLHLLSQLNSQFCKRFESELCTDKTK